MSFKIKNNFFKIPILLIAFNRPKYLGKLIEKLKIIQPKKIYIALDGPRPNIPEDKKLCKEVKLIFEQKINWDCLIKKKYEKKNLGTKKAVYSAISWFFKNEKMGIILEDDIEPDLTFFKFTEELLVKFENENKIKMISGNNYIKNSSLPKNSYYFSQTPATHGWATWKRAWDEVDINMSDWHKNDNFLKMLLFFKFNITRSHYFYKKFQLSFRNLIDLWDYQFFYSIIKRNGIIIKPSLNLCKHIGWGSDATRGKGKDTFPEIKSKRLNFPINHPNKIYINKMLDKFEDIKVRKLIFFNYFFKLIKKKFFK